MTAVVFLNPAVPSLVMLILWLTSLVAVAAVLWQLPARSRRIALGATAALVLASVTLYAQPVMDPCQWCTGYWCFLLGC